MGTLCLAGHYCHIKSLQLNMTVMTFPIQQPAQHPLKLKGSLQGEIFQLNFNVVSLCPATNTYYVFSIKLVLPSNSCK